MENKNRAITLCYNNGAIGEKNDFSADQFHMERTFILWHIDFDEILYGLDRKFENVGIYIFLFLFVNFAFKGIMCRN